MRILAICGSLQARSTNLTLLQTAVGLAPDGVEVVVFDGLRALPHFNPDLEAEGPIQAVQNWRHALAECDAVLIASPEYGFSLPGALKNGIDWVIGTGELERKIVAITASVNCTGRGVRGLTALRGTLEAVSARILGGVPIVRGPTFDTEVAAVVASVAIAVQEGRASRGEDEVARVR